MSRAASTDRAKAATAAWDRYRSTYFYGGTPQEKSWAFEHALVAEEKAIPWGQADRARSKADTIETAAVQKAA